MPSLNFITADAQVYEKPVEGKMGKMGERKSWGKRLSFMACVMPK